MHDILALSRDPKYRELSQNHLRTLEDLKATLDDKQLLLFMEYLNTYDELCSWKKDLLNDKIKEYIEFMF